MQEKTRVYRALQETFCAKRYMLKGHRQSPCAITVTAGKETYEERRWQPADPLALDSRASLPHAHRALR